MAKHTYWFQQYTDRLKKEILLTTTTIPGVAAKAIKSGYVLGTALEDYEESDPQKTDKIVV